MKKLFFPVLTFLIISSCAEVPDFSDYQGINFIASKFFDGGIETNWIRDDISGTYLTFTPFATAITTGLPAGTTDISRLEVLNLIPDGGFEGGLGSWTLFNGATGTPTGGNANTIHPEAGNNSLYFDINSNQRINFDLANLTDGAVDNGNYLIRFSFNRPSQNLPTIFEYNDGTNIHPGGSWNPKTTVSWDANGYDEFNYQTGEEGLVAIKPASSNIFSIGSLSDATGAQEGYFDDIRIVRTDISLCLRSTVPYSESGRPELISGTYRFGVYVKKEIAADINPANPNRFPSQILTLCINNKAEALDISSVTDSVWVNIYTNQFIQIYDGDTLALSMSPDNSTGTYTKDAGSILIASPSLTFVSD